MNNLAQILRAQGKVEDAEVRQENAVRLLQKVLGEHHPITLLVMDNLALTIQVCGNPAEAETMQRNILGL